VTPTVILNPEKDTPLMQEEIFGPVLPLITYKTFDEALQYVLSLDKPLATYYFGN
jgi:acyl-CoA reductase-like NAD-dependent aldehyde dehydrogenase